MIDLCNHCMALAANATDKQRSPFIFPAMEKRLREEGVRLVDHNRCPICKEKCPFSYSERQREKG